MEPFVLKNQSYLTIDNWIQQFPGLNVGFTTKLGGTSESYFESLNLGFHVGDVVNDVCKNRHIVAEQLEVPLDNWVGAEQTHDIIIRSISKADRGRGSNSYEHSFKGTDGFYTNEEGILLTLCFADCVPLFFIAPEQRMIGTAHAGWKGTVGQIAKEMITAWGNEGVKPDQIFVAIGPSICEKCYIVDERIIKLVENTLEGRESLPYNLVSEGQFSLDLREVNRQILLTSGVPDRNILLTKYCTSCNQEEFFSHRRDQGKTGRMLSFIGWKETANRL
ncbi:peptidoglycan editing factor PgeF [Neobacillus sp. PS2-9]|uniref:peptidoglycan editing factor PgeF n=1 Tax=Neobacillus sp. PS2-9 TaxID=3070676 RepID=UPI0027DEF783|nr:peptidoglycan editing factor PgeF [Neobacillus sp. PS2-9]WML56857.1 peptidoglycan editing factor PgeF [Neobacillus sp. PS2-9]